MLHIIKGNAILNTLRGGDLAISDAINRQFPTGGVSKPIPKLIVIIIPNCSAEIPYNVAIGKNIGANSNITGTRSIKHPQINSNIFIISITKNTLSTLFLKNPEIKVGTLSMFMVHETTDATPTINKDIAEVQIESEKICGISDIFNSLYTKKPIKSEYTTAITPASDAVTIPIPHPINIIRGIPNAQIASFIAKTRCFHDAFLHFG